MSNTQVIRQLLLDLLTEYQELEKPANPELLKLHIEAYEDRVETLIQEQVRLASKVTGETSDGYHTFNELYDYRRVYNAALFNEWARQGKYDVHKSLRHSDGELCFGGGWFVVVAELPTGQVTNHYEDKYYDEFKFIERERANKYDGHTPEEALNRIKELKNE